MVSVSFDANVQAYIDSHKDDSMNDEELLDLGSDYLLTRMDDIFKAHQDQQAIKKNYTQLLQQIEYEIATCNDLVKELSERRQLDVQMLNSLDTTTKEDIIKQDLCKYFLKTKDFMRAKLVYSPNVNLKEYINNFMDTMTMEDGKLQILLPLFELVKLAGVHQVDVLVVWYIELKNKQFDLALNEITLDFDLSEFAQVPFLKKFIEWFRVYITELMTSFTIIFNKLQQPHLDYLSWFTNQQIQKFLEICKVELVLIKDATQFHEISLQLMYCGLYLKQYNLDFRQELTIFIQNHITSLVLDKFATATEYFVDQVDRLNGLHPKNPIAANLINFIVSEKVGEYKSLFEQGNVFELATVPKTPVVIRFAESPPQLLIDFPLLAACLNGFLEGLNILYIFPMSDVHVKIGEYLDASLMRIAVKSHDIYMNNKDYLLGDHVYCLLHVLRFEFMPYLLKALVKGIYGDLTGEDYLRDAQDIFKIKTVEIFKLLETDFLKKEQIHKENSVEDIKSDENPVSVDEKSIPVPERKNE